MALTPEGAFKLKLKKELQKRLPGCVIVNFDTDAAQGVPDRIILYKDRWAALEVKKSRTAVRQPNQEYYIELFNEWSFAAFIYPENMEEVLDALQRSFEA